MLIKKALNLFKILASNINKPCKICFTIDEFTSLGNPYCEQCTEKQILEKNKIVKNEDEDEDEHLKPDEEISPEAIMISSLKRRTLTRFNRLIVGKYEVSIQASCGHECKPQQTLKNIDDYYKFEVAFRDNKYKIWIYPLEDPKFKYKNWAKYWNNGGDVGWQVPRKEVEQMLKDLYNA